MTQSLRKNALRLMMASFALTGVAAGGCVDDRSATPGETESPPTATPPEEEADGGTGTRGDDGGDVTTSDAGTDAAKQGDGGADAAPDASVKTGCAAVDGADFCDDFDSPDALTNGKTKWDILETQTTDQPVLTLVSDKAVSAPSSLLSRVVDATTPGARFVKTITKANFTEVTWSYDVYLDSIGAEDGFFLDDFQFPADDSYGFRLVMFAQGGAIKELKVEHNHAGIDTGYTIESPLPDGTITLGAWHHVEQTVKFTFGADKAPANEVEYSLWIDESATPAFQKEYEAPPREGVVHARFAGMPLVFNKERSAGLKIYWDNHVVGIK
jgi:hypothetical protein